MIDTVPGRPYNAASWFYEPQSGTILTVQTPVKRRARQESVRPVHAVRRAGAILFAFSAERPTLSLAEMAQAVRLSKSTARRLLLTLQDLDLVAVDPVSGRYRLGARCLEVAAVAQSGMDVRQRALPVMRQLVANLGETVYLLVRRGTDAVCLEIAEARRGPRVLFADVGSAFPLHAGAAPRALLAAAGDDVLRDVLAGPLRRFTAHTITDRAALRRDVSATRAAGHAFSVDDLVVGITGVGAVVWDHRREPVAAISVCGVKERFVGEERDRVVRTVVAAAREISCALGCPADRLTAGSWPAVPDPARASRLT